MGFRRDVGEAERHSADVVHYLVAPEANRLYGKLLRAWAGDGDALFPGVVVLVLAGWGLRRRWREPAAWAYGLAGAACAVLTLGPAIKAGGHAVCPGPYALLFRCVPGYEGLRNPTRFAMPLMLCLASLSAWGYAAMLGRLATSRRWVLGAGVFVLVAAEYCCIPLGASAFPRHDGLPEPSRWLATRDDIEVVLHKPFDLDVLDRLYLYYSTYHWKKLVNGVSGWSPPEDLAKYFTAVQLPSPETAQLMSDLGVGCVLIHSDAPAAVGPEWEVLQRFDDAVAIAPRVRPKGLSRPLPRLADCDRSRWRVVARPCPERARLAVDGRLDAAWSTERAQRQGDGLVIDLGETVTVGSVHVWVGQRPDLLPVSCLLAGADGPGMPWRTLTTGVDFASFYRTCLLDHRDARLIFDVPRSRCRLLKLTDATRSAHARPWSVAEVAVYPPSRASEIHPRGLGEPK